MALVVVDCQCYGTMAHDMTAQTPAPRPSDERTPFREWNRAGRWTVYLTVLVVLALLGVFLVGVAFVRHPFPQTAGTVRVHGLVGNVDIDRDSHGIPQVYADSARDLFFGQGYAQAQDRFYEMDFRRHLTSGRLSEMLGRGAVATDQFIRVLGWRRVAEQEYPLLSEDTRSYLQAYSDGVNAYLSGKGPTRLSLEYAVLGLGGLSYKPEKWTPVDSLAWLKAMAWDLRGNMDEEIERARLSVSHSPEEIAELYPAYPYDQSPPIVPGNGAAGQAARTALSSGIGSNSWVVSGRYTRTGKPLLANDPHLAPSAPSVWYQMGLHCRTVDADCPFDVTGFTFAGVPGVIIGHNQRVSWGFTNLGPDVTDLYLEKVEGHRYLYRGKWRPLKEHDEKIEVAGGGRKTITVRATRHGPLLSDVSSDLSSVGANAAVPAGSPERGNGYAVALAWTALHPSRTGDAIFALDRAQNWTEFRGAARRFAVPSQNLVYADVDGNIGYQAPGRIPIRRNGRSGDYPAAGWLPRNDWTGRYVPFAALPNELNPASGVIVTANQAVTGPGYPYHLSDSWDRGYRAERIRRLLSSIGSRHKLTVGDMARIQNDTVNPAAPVLVRYLLRLPMPTRYYRAGKKLLRHWDYTQPADSAAAAYFNVVWSNLLRLTFHDQLRPSLWPDGGQRWVGVVSPLLADPTNKWWDDVTTPGTTEDRDMILSQAMQDARDELTRRLSVDPKHWQWGRLHRLDLQNQSLGQSGHAVVRGLFNRDGIAIGGGSAAVDASEWDATLDYHATDVPSMRMVVDLANLDRSRWINLTGASGHAFDRHYTDQTRLWVSGKTLPWPSSRKAVHAATQQRLVLKPEL